MNQSNEPLHPIIGNANTNEAQSLDEQAEALQLALQLNREILLHTFLQKENCILFPRSYTMRFLMQHNIQKILKKNIGALIGSKTLHSLSYGVNTAYFAYRTIIKK